MSPKLLNILLILTPVVLYLGYINPYYTGEEGMVWTPEKSIKVLQGENSQYENTLSQVALVKDAVEKLNKDYQGIDQGLREDVTTMLPDTIDTVKLRNEIITIAANSGVAVESIDVKDAKDLRGERGATYYKISFTLRSKYPAFKTFMENYEKNKRFFILEQATISRPDDTKDQAKKDTLDKEVLNINIASRVYYLK